MRDEGEESVPGSIGAAGLPIADRLLDAIALTLIVVDGARTVLLANAAARQMLVLSQPFFIRNGQMELAGPDQARYRDHIQACATATGQFVLNVPRPGRSAVRALLASLPGAECAGSVAVIVMDHERKAGVSANLIAHVYGLTPAEGRVVLELLNGRELVEIAGILAVSLFTVRSHVRHALARTGAANQRDLVRRLALELGSLSFRERQMVNPCDSKTVRHS